MTFAAAKRSTMSGPTSNAKFNEGRKSS